MYVEGIASGVKVTKAASFISVVKKDCLLDKKLRRTCDEDAWNSSNLEPYLICATFPEA